MFGLGLFDLFILYVIFWLLERGERRRLRRLEKLQEKLHAQTSIKNVVIGSDRNKEIIIGSLID